MTLLGQITQNEDKIASSKASYSLQLIGSAFLKSFYGWQHWSWQN